MERKADPYIFHPRRVVEVKCLPRWSFDARHFRPIIPGEKTSCDHLLEQREIVGIGTCVVDGPAPRPLSVVWNDDQADQVDVAKADWLHGSNAS